MSKRVPDFPVTTRFETWRALVGLLRVKERLLMAAATVSTPPPHQVS
jgi:hypothetical protein